MKLIHKLWALLLLVQFSANAEIRLPALVKDHMVLQRDIKIPVWGWANAGEKIDIVFKSKTYKTTADQQGKWSLSLDKLAAGGPYELLVKGQKEQILLKDILIGDVWICSGQSNMAFDFNNGRARALYAKDIAASENDQIRQIFIPHTTSPVPLDNVKNAGWKSAKPTNLNAFSVAAYFFARAIYEQYKVPVGLIHTSWGATKAEAWTSEETIKSFPQFDKEVKLLQDSVKLLAKVQERRSMADEWHRKNKTEDKGYTGDQAVWAAADFKDTDWKTVNTPVMFDKFGFPDTYGVIWFRKEINVPESLAGKDAVLKLGSVDDEDESFVNGVKVGGYANREKPREHQVPGNLIKAGRNVITVRIINWNGPAGFAGDQPMKLDFGTAQIPADGVWKYQPGRLTGALPGLYNTQDLATSLYNGMLAPLIPYGIKGVIWYQGESNEVRAYEYRDLFPAMIASWRAAWKQGDFPFIFQQLVNFKQVKPQPGESDWAELREAQLMTLAKSPNTAMSIGIDIGESGDIHPVNKLDIGRRLALGARKIAYKEQHLVACGPLYKSMQLKGDHILISFNSIGDGLVAKADGQPAEGGGLRYFAIAGKDKKFYWAKARIKGDQVEVSSADVPEPVAVRYAWADNPEGCNLFNKNGLPASPFRTDDWEGITAKKKGK